MQSKSWLVDAWFFSLLVVFFISRSLHVCSPLGCSSCNSCSRLYECVRWKMFALKKVPKLHTITRILSDDEHSLSLCLISGCKHGRLKISSLPLTNDLRLSLLKFGLLLLSPTRHTIAHAHEYSYVCKCKNREQGYSTLSEGGFCVRFSEVCRSQPLCAMERVSDVQNNRK